jgi:16S rRNA (adenine1518-N6/adenine1519-N6)-dimethyltransferase
MAAVNDNAPDSPADLLRRFGLKPKYSWGQNFLGDGHALKKIADAVGLQKDDPVVELGPGLGHLTRALLATGAKVTAVERDRDMVRVLESMKLPGLTVVAGNAAEIDFAKTAGVDQIAVVGNLPYHLSSSILFEVLDQSQHVTKAVFTLQLEVVTRLAAPPGGRDYGLLSVLLGLRYEVELVFKLSRNLFHPPPNVDSAVVRLTRSEQPAAEVTDEARFRKLVKAGFAHRRKTLLNSLKGDPVFKAMDLSAALQRAGIDGIRRAETLSVAEFAALERAL